MDLFQSTQLQYQQLLGQLQAGTISREAFDAAAVQLRVQDAQGIWWTISFATGNWCYWDGAAWVEAPQEPASNQPSTPPPSGHENTGLGNEVAASVKTSAALMLSQLPKTIVRQVLGRLPVMALSGISVWVLHSILLVWKNEGFNSQAPWGPYLNAVGGTSSIGSAAVIWGLPMALFWSSVVSLFKCGPTATIKMLFSGPATALAVPLRGGSSLAGYCIGGGGALLLATFFGLNRQAGTVLTLSSIFLAAGYPGMLLARVFSDLWTRVVKPRATSAIGRVEEVSRSAVIGLTPGFLLLAILPAKLRSIAALGLIGGGIYLLISQRGAPPPTSGTPDAPGTPASPASPGGTMALLAWFLSSAATITLFDILFGTSAYADDGGSNEIRGGDGTNELNWTNTVAWWNSQGSGQAISQGAVPGMSAAAGAGLIPPLAPPTGGLVITDDVTKGETTKKGETFDYSCDAQTTGGMLIPADGRTSQQFYAISSTNNPKWTVRQMNATVHFSFSAPTGFTLEAQRVFSAGDGSSSKHVDVICVPPSDAAYAPGRIPGVVYASASSPQGTVQGHYAVQIEVGGGEMILNPLERDWVRGPMPGMPPDSLTLFARLALPDYCVAVPASELNANLSLRTLGDCANYLYVSPPEDPEGWRSWNIAVNDQLQPEHLKSEVIVEMGLEGRIMAGLLQKPFTLRVLAHLQLKCDPAEPFLVKEFLEEVEVLVTVQGAAPGEEWTIEDPVFVSGDQAIILPGAITPNPPAAAKLKFQLGNLPDDRDEAGAKFRLKARLTKAVKDYSGPGETEDFDLHVSCRRPGLIFLTKMPVNIPGDGKTPAKFSLTVLKFTPGEGGKPGMLSADEEMLKEKALQFAEKIEAEGAAAGMFNAAALQITYDSILGEGLDRRACYSVKGSAVIPGTGETVLGKLEISVPNPPPTGKKEDYSKKLELGLVTVKVPDQTDDYATEKKLMLQALDEMILRPYATLQASWADASKLEWEADWVRSWWGQSAEDALDQLMKLYDKFKDEIEKDTRHDAFNLHQRRRDFYFEVTKAWQAVATSSGGVETVLAAGELTANTAKWLSEALFPKLVEIALVSMGRSPKWADFGGSAAGYFQKYINLFAGNCAQAYVDNDPNPWNKAGQATIDDIWNNLITDMFDLFYGSQAEKPFEKKFDFGLSGPEGLAHGIRVKSRLYAYFAIIKLFQHWVWEKKENGDDKGFAEACKEVLTDLAAKSVADSFEWFCGDVPKGGATAAMSNFRGAVGDSYGEIVEFLKKCERLGQGRA